MTDDAIRVDKWLWHARLFKSRTQASRLCRQGRIRVEGRVIAKADHRVAPGNVLTVPTAREIRVVRVLAVGARRGPAAKARLLYETIPPDGGLAGAEAGAGAPPPRPPPGAGP